MILFIDMDGGQVNTIWAWNDGLSEFRVVIFDQDIEGVDEADLTMFEGYSLVHDKMVEDAAYLREVPIDHLEVGSNIHRAFTAWRMEKDRRPKEFG